MPDELRYDENAARQLEAVYTTPEVVAQRVEVLRALALAPGERVLDLGVGPGFLATEMVATLRPGGSIACIDVSASMLTLARARCAPYPEIEIERGDATLLPYADGRFDAVVSAQVLEYVTEVDRAIAEVRRALRPGGRLVLLDTDWESIVWNSLDPRRMERVLLAWEAHCPHPRLPRTLGPRLERAGFRLGRPSVIPLFNPTYDENTYSARISALIAAFVASREGLAQEAVAWSEDLRRTAEAGEYFFSLNRYLFSAVKPG